MAESRTGKHSECCGFFSAVSKVPSQLKAKTRHPPMAPTYLEFVHLYDSSCFTKQGDQGTTKVGKHISRVVSTVRATGFIQGGRGMLRQCLPEHAM